MKDNFYIEILTWAEARRSVAKANKLLAAVIDTIDPPQKCALYRARYRYGQPILKRGVLQVPTPAGELVSIDSLLANSSIRKDLDYSLSAMPIGMVLNHSLELCLKSVDREILYALFNPGHIFGLWGCLDAEYACEGGAMWDVISGARSIFMLPKITDGAGHRRLQHELGISAARPKVLQDQWNVFVDIANTQTEEQAWFVEVIFFSGEWFKHRKDSTWMPFYYYLYEHAWKISAFARNREIYDFIFSTVCKTRNLKPDPYLSDTVKYLMQIGLQESPGFAPAQDDSAAPIGFIQQVYQQVYQLKNYAPIMMQPSYLSPGAAVFYSFQCPTLKDFAPKGRKLASKFFDLREIHHLLKVLTEEILKNQFQQECYRTSLFRLMERMEFRYFHTDANESHKHILHPRKAANEAIFRDIMQQFPGTSFCENGSFFWGCIEIMLKNTRSL